MPEIRITAKHIDIEFDSGTNPINAFSRETQRVKMYNMPRLGEQIKLWLICYWVGANYIQICAALHLA